MLQQSGLSNFVSIENFFHQSEWFKIDLNDNSEFNSKIYQI